MDSESVVAICDAGPLIHLDELNSIQLLDGFAKVIIPDVVWREALSYRPALGIAESDYFIRSASDLPLSPILQSLTRVLSLHAGELWALNSAIATANCILLTDDMPARVAAKGLGIPAYGTLGLLLRSVRLRLRSADEIALLLSTIGKRSSLHVRKDVLEDAIRQLNEIRSTS